MNWQEMIRDISNAGYTQQQIANEVGCAQSLVSQVLSGKRGRSLKYEYGLNLGKLHKKVTRKAARQHKQCA